MAVHTLTPCGVCLLASYSKEDVEMATTITATRETVTPTVEQKARFYEHLALLSGRAPSLEIPAPSPVPVPVPVPIPIPVLVGSRFLIWKQDPSVTDPGIRLTFIPSLVLDGPRDSRITTNL